MNQFFARLTDLRQMINFGPEVVVLGPVNSEVEIREAIRLFIQKEVTNPKGYHAVAEIIEVAPADENGVWFKV